MTNITTITPSAPITTLTIDFGLTQAAITLLAGLLIFFTLGRHFRVFDVTQQSESSPLRIRSNLEGWLLYFTFMFVSVAIAYSLFDELQVVAKIILIVSLLTLLALVYRILRRPMPPSPSV